MLTQVTSSPNFNVVQRCSAKFKLQNKQRLAHGGLSLIKSNILPTQYDHNIKRLLICLMVSMVTGPNAPAAHCSRVYANAWI